MAWTKSWTDPSTQQVTAAAYWKIVDVHLQLAPHWAAITIWIWVDGTAAAGNWNPIAKLPAIVLRPDEFDAPVSLGPVGPSLTIAAATEGFAQQLILQRPDFAGAQIVP